MNSIDQKHETSQKNAICIMQTVSYSILSPNIDIVKIFCVFHIKVALTTQENIDQKINFCDWWN